MRIFGREPALIIGFIGAVLTVLGTLNIGWLPAAAVASIIGGVSAVIIAVTTRPVSPALFVAAVLAVVPALAAYGLDLSDAVVGGISGLLLAGFALFGVRPQVSPASEVS